MTAKPTPFIIYHFSSIEDPRVNRQKKHQLQDIFFISICAMICEADNWVAVEEFGLAKEEWFTKLLGLEYGIPSHDTLPSVQFMLPLIPISLASVFPAGLLI
jgi:hypothetical protein